VISGYNDKNLAPKVTLWQHVKVVYIGDDEEMYVTRTFYNKETGNPTRQLTRNQAGQLHSPPDGTPSEVHFDDQGRPIDLIWHPNNVEHREVAPSAILMYPDTGQSKCEQFYVEGQPISPQEGPFRVFFAEDGSIIREVMATELDRIPDETLEQNRNRLEP